MSTTGCLDMLNWRGGTHLLEYDVNVLVFSDHQGDIVVIGGRPFLELEFV
jgi:hypothetical protein